MPFANPPYPEAFRRRLVTLVLMMQENPRLKHKAVGIIAERHGVRQNTLRQWMSRARDEDWDLEAHVPIDPREVEEDENLVTDVLTGWSFVAFDSTATLSRRLIFDDVSKVVSVVQAIEDLRMGCTVQYVNMVTERHADFWDSSPVWVVSLTDELPDLQFDDVFGDGLPVTDERGTGAQEGRLR